MMTRPGNIRPAWWVQTLAIAAMAQALRAKWSSWTCCLPQVSIVLLHVRARDTCCTCAPHGRLLCIMATCTGSLARGKARPNAVVPTTSIVMRPSSSCRLTSVSACAARARTACRCSTPAFICRSAPQLSAWPHTHRVHAHQDATGMCLQTNKSQVITLATGAQLDVELGDADPLKRIHRRCTPARHCYPRSSEERRAAKLCAASDGTHGCAPMPPVCQNHALSDVAPRKCRVPHLL
jgi:hypothetical protein